MNLSVITVWLGLFFGSTGIYDFSFETIEGQTKSMSLYQGKKILVVTLPLQHTASSDSILFSLDTLAKNNSALIQVIAVPSKEDGFTESNKAALRQWYRSKLGNEIVIMDGVYTRKSAGTNQHVLFRWLTHEVENEHFDLDANAPGFKYFISSQGELYGVLSPTTRIWGLSVQQTIRL